MDYYFCLVSFILGFSISFIYHFLHYHIKLNNIISQFFDFFYLLIIGFILCFIYNSICLGKFNFYLLFFVVLGSTFYCFFWKKRSSKNFELNKSFFLFLLPFFKKILSFLFIPKIFSLMKKK